MKGKFWILTGILCSVLSAGALIAKQQIPTKSWTGYDNAWAKVDSLDAISLPESGLAIVEEIYAHAKEEKNRPQLIKSIIYKAKYTQILQEDGDIKAIKIFEDELAQSAGVDKAILQRLTADLYWQYYAANRYKIAGRTNLEKTKSDDIATWDIAAFHQKMNDYYLASISQRELLKKTPLGNYDIILEPGNTYGEFLRPTVFDLLAQDALNYFTNYESTITKPATAQHINNPILWESAKQFSGYAFTAADSNLIELPAVRILQELTTAHLYDPYPDVIIDLNLQRYQFANAISMIDDADSLHLRALERDVKQYGLDSASARISAALGQWHMRKAQLYNPFEGNTYKWEYQTAAAIYENAIAKFPNSFGAEECKSGLMQITATGLSEINIARANVPDEAILASVQYKNIDSIYLKLIQIAPDKYQKLLSMDYQEKAAELKKYQATRQWNQPLPDDGDHQFHRVDFKIDPLPLGTYVLLSSEVKDFSGDSNTVSVNELVITNMAYVAVETNANNGVKRFYVVDRTTGEPMAGVKVNTYRQEYDYAIREYRRNMLQELVTDKQGMFEVRDPLIRTYYTFGFSLSKGKDVLESENGYYITKPEEKPNREFESTIMFTDRAIYRPGQTIYFKGIMFSSDRDERTKQVLVNKKTLLTLFDMNYQKVASLELTTNDYGSFAGSFTAPSTGLTGQYRVVNENGSAYFSVEEYKRPTFSVTLEELKGDYILNDSIPIHGSATAYSGAVIDQAKVHYRVTRFAYYPYYFSWSSYKSIPRYQSNEVEVANGEVVTGADGKFEIPFKAIPGDENPKDLPVYNYAITVDITDVSGETISSATSISVGYSSLLINLAWDDAYYTDKPVALNLNTTNLNYQHLDAKGTLVLYPLEAPDKLLRERSFPRPDTFLMTEAAFRKAFPHDIYDDENNPAAWKMGAAALTIPWNTATSDSVIFSLNGLRQGVYKAVVESVDKSGRLIKSESIVSVLNPGSYTTYPKYFLYPESEITAQPGEDAIVSFGSSVRNAKALVAIYRNDGSFTINWVALPEISGKKLDGVMTDLTIPVNESDRGGLSVKICMVADGRAYNTSVPVTVPWTNKELQVKLETYHDKLQPGSKETWKLHISGSKGEKVSAELLASMYDASLDAFSMLSWPEINYPNIGYFPNMSVGGMDLSYAWRYGYPNAIDYSYSIINYPALNWFGFYLQSNYYYRDDRVYDFIDQRLTSNNEGEQDDQSMTAPKFNANKASSPLVTGEFKSSADTEKLISGNAQYGNGGMPVATIPLAQVPLRTNLNETAFFYPQLETDSLGNVVFSFTMPEALTTWKFMAFAHTPDLKSGSTSATVVTQKELMIQPNMPRFLREGDQITLTAKISNLTDKQVTGKAQLELLNAINMQPVDVAFANTHALVDFSAAAKGSAAVKWDIQVPAGIDAIVYRVKAANETFSDGEENGLPVLTNKILVTESIPLWARGNQVKEFNFTKLLNSNTSSTLRNQSVTLEYTSNPAWYAVQALPYMMEYPYECAEQVFSRYYANSIAYFVANSDPEIRRVYDSYKNNPSALASNLEKNEELKSLLLEETPWVLQAQNETERKKRVALLFDNNKLQSEQAAALNKLQKMQLPNGGWPWFGGDKDDPYITQLIVTGLVHLEQMGVIQPQNNAATANMLQKAIIYCNARMLETYNELDRLKIDKKTYVPDNLIIQYLYATSYFGEERINLDAKQKEARDYFVSRIEKQWTSYNLYSRGMIALVLNRSNRTDAANAIVKSLRENSLRSDEMGMYWKSNTAGYYWYQAPIETQALMIEVFNEVAKDKAAVDALKVWLLRQKQTSDWKTTRATAEACYALLSGGSNLLAQKEATIVMVGNMLVQPDKVEMGTGYFKTNWLGSNIKPELGKITITPPKDNVLSYGAMYWQYFEDMDKVTSAETNLKLTKQLFVEKDSPNGPVLTEINDKTVLHVGDKIVVRIVLKSDRDMEYVHMKDMRASGFDPVNVISSYKWQGGLGYYEATADASTNFFISYLPKGTFVFEYPLRVRHAGVMSNGITTIQSMYAPEFSAHSEGIKVTVQ